LRSVSTLFGLTFTAVGCAGAVGPMLLGRAYDLSGSYETALVQLAAGMVAVATLLLALPPAPSAKVVPHLS
jgi:cyanate permease